MSINHYSKTPEPRFYWSPYVMDPSSSNHQKPIFMSHLIPKTVNFLYGSSMLNLSNGEEEEELVVDDTYDSAMEMERERKIIQKEALFEKPLTPSDVGKLNRLVIPKQHAEKYFPLSGGDAGEKGFLLSFEDDTGKTWRFRYSYWNSSQSYVLTKGWSRFVKDKRLDAGDFVQFSRHHFDTKRLFIGWRRRHENGGAQLPAAASGGYYQYPFITPYLHQETPSYHHHTVTGDSSINKVAGNTKKVRLFGVNLECDSSNGLIN